MYVLKKYRLSYKVWIHRLGAKNISNLEGPPTCKQTPLFHTPDRTSCVGVQERDTSSYFFPARSGALSLLRGKNGIS